MYNFPNLQELITNGLFSMVTRVVAYNNLYTTTRKRKTLKTRTKEKRQCSRGKAPRLYLFLYIVRIIKERFFISLADIIRLNTSLLLAMRHKKTKT